MINPIFGSEHVDDGSKRKSTFFKDFHNSTAQPVIENTDEDDLLNRELREIEDEPTPPDTPPELEPGKTGCGLFREQKHFINSIYLDPEYQRVFTCKLIIGNVFCYMPTLLFLVCIKLVPNWDYHLVHQIDYFIYFLVFGVIGFLLFAYFVGLCRNNPFLTLAMIGRVVLITMILSSAMMILHYSFLEIITFSARSQLEGNETESDVLDKALKNSKHSPAYMATLCMCLVSVYQLTMVYMHLRWKFPVNDFRIPVFMYTVNSIVSAILVTIILHGGFGNEPVGYDLFQVLVGCHLSTRVNMRALKFIDHLYEGKICPLRKGEFFYALIHFGIAV